MGRWGNFFNQEAYGAAVTQPSRMHFPLAVFIDADQTWHYATFFYESAWCFLIVALLLLFGTGGVSSGKGATCFSGI